MFKKLNFIFILVSAAFLFTSCSGNEKGTELKFWAMGTEGEILKQLVPEFERRNPGIKVDVQMIPWTAAQEKLITAYASNNTPDACQLGNTWIPQFAALDAIENLNTSIKNSRVVKKEDYFEGIWETNVIDESVYGIPWYIDTRVLYYRTDILAEAGYNEPPRNWDELYDACKKIKQLHPGNYPIYIPVNEWANFIIFGLQANASILKNNNSYGNFSSPEFKKAFHYLIKYHKEKLSPAGITEVTNIYQAMAEGYINMYISGPWNLTEFKKWMTGSLKDKWSTAALPGLADSVPGVSLAGGASLVIFKNSEKKGQAWKFIEYLSEPSTQVEFYKIVNNLPAVKKAWENPLLSEDKYMKAFYKQFHYVMPTPKIPEWEQIVFAKLQQYMELAARGSMPEGQALKLLDKDVNDILEKRRWLLSKEN
jgi:multiple sugar transport system substrate-binding protein